MEPDVYKRQVLQAMSEIVNNEMEKQEPVEQEAPQKSFDEMTFEEALEASPVSYTHLDRGVGRWIGQTSMKKSGLFPNVGISRAFLQEF